MARCFIEQQSNLSPRIRLAQESEKGLKVLLPHIRTAQDNPMPGAGVEGAEQHAFGIATGNGHDGLLAA